MTPQLVRAPTSCRVGWADVVWPREHGSWSLAFEPVAFGLLAAASPAGAALAGSVAAGFFLRRPLRVLARDTDADRRRRAAEAVAVLGGLALAGGAIAVAVGGAALGPWLAPTVAAGAVFLAFDLRGEGRQGAAELAGAAAFAWLPAVFAAAAGWRPAAAIALAAVMIGRAVPTVWLIRALLRTAKGEAHGAGAPVAAAWFAAGLAAALWRAGLAPAAAFAALAVLAARATFWAGWPRPALRARTLGIVEAVLGVAFVAVAAAWTAAAGQIAGV